MSFLPSYLNLEAESTVATPLNVDIHVMDVTGLSSSCCSSLRQVPCSTSHSLTAAPAALRARGEGGEASRTHVTGPEWPVRVERGFSELAVVSWTGLVRRDQSFTVRSSEP